MSGRTVIAPPYPTHKIHVNKANDTTQAASVQHPDWVPNVTIKHITEGLGIFLPGLPSTCCTIWTPVRVVLLVQTLRQHYHQIGSKHQEPGYPVSNKNVHCLISCSRLPYSMNAVSRPHARSKLSRCMRHGGCRLWLWWCGTTSASPKSLAQTHPSSWIIHRFASLHVMSYHITSSWSVFLGKNVKKILKIATSAAAAVPRIRC